MDRINIQHPDQYDPESRYYRDRLEIDKLKIELKQLRAFHDEACDNLKAIFNRVEKGEPAELHYPDGRVFVISGKERK